MFHRIRYLFQGWRRLTNFIQAFFFCLLILFWGGVLLDGEAPDQHLSASIFFALSLGIHFFINQKKLALTRAISLLALCWTTLLWVEALIPGSIYHSLGLGAVKYLGYEYLCLGSFSAIALFGIGYPFPWLGKSRIGVMIVGGLVISLIGYVVLTGRMITASGVENQEGLCLLGVALSLVVWGTAILVKGIQDCLEEGSGYWSQIPYASASVMFVLTMTLWSAFHIHEQEIWNREIESSTIKIGDQFERRFLDLSQTFERFCRTISYQEKIKRSEWKREGQLFLEQENSIISIDRFPQDSHDWRIIQKEGNNSTDIIPSALVTIALRRSVSNEALWITAPFPLLNGGYGIGLVSKVSMPMQSPFEVRMGVAFNPLFEGILKEESQQIDIRISGEGMVLKDFDEEQSAKSRHYFNSELYFYGVNYKIEGVPRHSFFQKRDHFLSIGFFLAGLSFSILFGTLVGLYIHLHHDSLELREINDRLGLEIEVRRKAEIDGENKNRDLETLIYVVSHDLREPLRGIESFSRLIYERYLDRLDEKGKDFLRRIVFSSMRLDRLLDDITMLSRVQRAEPPDSPVAGRELVMEALSRLEAVTKSKGAEITVARDLPLLWVNRTWGTQAIFNLIGNALKFSLPEQAPIIEVRGYRAENGDQEGVQILDRGPGIKPEHVERIFKLFQRAVGREVEGTGAGLAIVKQIAERHRGKVWYEPREGGGSCFTLTFAKINPNQKKKMVGEDERA